MPIYKYECPACQGEHDELKKVEDRAEDVCPTCGATAKLVIVPVHLDYLRCGVDLGLPTAAAKWDKLQRRKNSGQDWDSNNLRYGGEYEKPR